MQENKKLEDKEMLKIWEKGKQEFIPGHRTCSGCFIPTIVRTVLGSVPENYEPVVSMATSCLEVTSTIWPHTSWDCSCIHNAFENSASTLAGVERAYVARKNRGEIKNKYKFVAFGGDGGTLDIGLQSLSGVLERGHDILYVLYDNSAYENTGAQRSGSTPLYANTATTPAGEKSFGKPQQRKDIMKIVDAHNIPYLAQANPFYIEDFVSKIKKAFTYDGPKFLSVLMPCNYGWKFPQSQTVDICKLATESNFWPLYEIENGKYKLTYEPQRKVPVEDYLKTNKLYSHLFKPSKNEKLIAEIQKGVDNYLEFVKKMSEMQKH